MSAQKIVYKVVRSDDPANDWSVVCEVTNENGESRTERIRDYTDKWKASVVAAAMNHEEGQKS